VDFLNLKITFDQPQNNKMIFKFVWSVRFKDPRKKDIIPDMFFPGTPCTLLSVVSQFFLLVLFLKKNYVQTGKPIMMAL
jgi:hypothetical protein